MEIETWYSGHSEAQLKGRYVHSEQLESLLKSYRGKIKIEEIGASVLGVKIKSMTIGNGPKKILAWSQMHGNESTTTKALFDFFKFLTQNEYYQEAISRFLKEYTFCAIPILNPDGAKAYTRENANDIDLNRDAKNLTQPESNTLRDLFNSFKPTLCLNLHDQRTLYSLPTGKSATVSFLAPAANSARSITKSRSVAMEHIDTMATVLSTLIPGQIGRYDDAFNDNCVGDMFQYLEVPTILFEAGHFPGDYEREVTRKYIFYAYLALFDLYPGQNEIIDRVTYNSIPQNEKDFRDIMIRNARFEGSDGLQSIAIQFEEQLKDGKILLVPMVDNMGDLSNYLGHKELDVAGANILLNSHENVFVGEKVSTIVDKNAVIRVFFKDSVDFF